MMKIPIALSRISVLILLAGCAGPMGPPLGLGPGWDEFTGAVIVAIVVLLAYRPVRRLLSSRATAPDLASPQQTVKQRYARGEINEEEFLRMMKHFSQL